MFIACLSQNSVAKRGMIQKEVRIALEISEEQLDSDIFIIHVRLDACEVPAPLRRYQWVDYFEPNAWERLVDGIQIGLRRRAR